jgi:hypothetical protein
LGRPFLSTTGAYVDCSEGKIVFKIYDEEIVRYFPKKNGNNGRYIPPGKRTYVVSVPNKGHSEVRLPT